MSMSGRPHSGPAPDWELAPEAITRIVLRPVTTSLPLGFLAFGAGTILLTALELDATGIRVRDLPITPDKLLCRQRRGMPTAARSNLTWTLVPAGLESVCI